MPGSLRPSDGREVRTKAEQKDRDEVKAIAMTLKFGIGDEPFHEERSIKPAAFPVSIKNCQNLEKPAGQRKNSGLASQP
jgi:hypothetical protein